MAKKTREKFEQEQRLKNANIQLPKQQTANQTTPSAFEVDSETLENEPLVGSAISKKPYATENLESIGEIPDSIPEFEFEKQVVNFNEGTMTGMENEDGSMGSASPSSSVMDGQNNFSKEDSRSFNNGNSERSTRTEKQNPSPLSDVKNPFNDSMTPKQKSQSAEFLADSAIDSYCWLVSMGKDYLKFDDDKMQAKALVGEFDFDVLRVQIPLNSSGTEKISIHDFLQSMNEQADQIMVVPDEFKEKVRPVLIEIFKKKGWGATPEQRLMLLVAEDAAPKLGAIFQIKKLANKLLENSMQILAQQKAGIKNAKVNTMPPPAQQTPVITQQQPMTQQPQPQMQVYVNPDVNVSQVVNQVEKEINSMPEQYEVNADMVKDFNVQSNPMPENVAAKRKGRTKREDFIKENGLKEPEEKK
jgi:hypothetical protein